MGIRMTLAVACLWLALAPAMGSAKIIYVDGDAPGPNNGTSWANAFKNLQDGLAQATQGDEIWVAQGTYKPDKGAGQTAGDRQATFQLVAGVKVYGGYPGYGQPKPNARNIQANPTVLSGDLLGNDLAVDTTTAVIRDVLADPTRQDNAYVVVTGTGADATALLSGFTLSGGVANSTVWPQMFAGQGAGLFIYKGSPTIQDCTFKDNLSTLGGAAVAGHEAGASFSNCTFTGNLSLNYGGAVTSWASSMTFGQCAFSANRSDDNRRDEVGIHWTGLGGAIYNWDGHLAIAGSTFEHNGGCFDGGALFNGHTADANLVDCRFVANSSTSGAGAIEDTDGATLTLTRCVFLQNTAWSQGGAIRCTDAKTTMNQCRFLADTASDSGGALYNVRSDVTLVGCLFAGNKVNSRVGGAVGLEGCTTLIVNCTFASNVSPVGGAAIGCLPSDDPTLKQSWLEIANSILWDQANEILCQDRTVPIVLYSDVFDELGLGQWTVWANEHNLSQDPRFVDAKEPDGVAGTEDDNLKLIAGSPCIDSGDNGWVPAGTLTDLDGGKRFVDDPDTADTGAGVAPIVDRGAYEYVKRVPGPGKPVANAGPDRTVFAGLDSLAHVTLDGSASSDPDADPLTYAWTWKVGTTNYQATGATPDVALPVGATTVTLVVNDGRQNSSPDTVVVTVLGPFTAKTSVQPEEIDRSDPRIEYVMVLMQLSEIAASDVDSSQPVVLTPGQIPSGGQSVFDYRQGQTFMTTIMAVFDKAALMQAIPTNGATTLTITGKLTSGRTFSGSAPVTIVGTITPDTTAPTPNPMEWAKADPTVKDPNDPNLYAGEPRAVLLDPRADNGTGETGWAIAMRAIKATDPKGGIEYQFDCFEDDSLDRTWSSSPLYTTAEMKRTDVVKYTFRCRARNKTGGMTAWSKWAWVTATPTP